MILIPLTNTGRGLSQYTMDSEGNLAYPDAPTVDNYTLQPEATSWYVEPELTPEQALDSADQTAKALKEAQLNKAYAYGLKLGCPFSPLPTEEEWQEVSNG